MEVVIRDPDAGTELVVPRVVPKDAIMQLVQIDPAAFVGRCSCGIRR
jgi:hypothetical protein